MSESTDFAARRRAHGAAAPGRRTAAARVLALLEAFSRGRGALTLTEIGRDADLPLSTTHRLVHEVMQWGGLEVDDQGRYRLSRKFVDLAAGSTNELRLRDAAMPALIDLYRATGLTVHLAARDDDEVVYLEALRSHPNYTGQSRMGGRLALHMTATGIVLLAYAAPEDIEEYLERPLKPFASGTPTSAVRLRALLEDTRRMRCAITERFLAEGAGSVAAPVTDATGRVVAAVGVTFAIGRANPRDLADRIRITARRIADAASRTPSRLDPRTIDYNRRCAGIA